MGDDKLILPPPIKPLSKPQGKDNWEKKVQSLIGKPIDVPERRTVYLLIDCSGSMAVDNKMEQAKSGAYNFAVDASKKNYSIGIINFDSTAQLILSAQKNLSEINNSLKSLRATGSTNMTDAFNLAISCFDGVKGEKFICIVTDGEPDNRMTTLQARNRAVNVGVEIMTIGTDDADKDFLDQLATRKELSVKVSRQQLKEGISDMAKLLPGK